MAQSSATVAMAQSSATVVIDSAVLPQGLDRYLRSLPKPPTWNEWQELLAALRVSGEDVKATLVYETYCIVMTQYFGAAAHPHFFLEPLFFSSLRKNLHLLLACEITA